MAEKAKVQFRQSIVVRFSGDSGDGMQLAGNIFSNVSAGLGDRISTFPDYPAEVRAPQGSLGGVSGFQVHIGHGVHTPGDECDVLVAMNPAALKVNAQFLRKGGAAIVDIDTFTQAGLDKALYTTQQQNIGKVENTGFELTVNGDILRGKDYVLSGNLTLGHNKMKVKELNASDDVLYNNSNRFYSSGKDDYILQVGGEVGLLYGYVYDGLYTTNDFDMDTWNNKTKWVLKPGVTTDVLAASTSGDPSRPGKIKFKDLDGDGKITDKDRTVIGNTNPKWQGGFGLSGQYKDFDFTANFTYMLDFDVYNGTAYALSSSSGKATEYTNVLDEFGRDNRWVYTANYGSHDDYTTTAKTVLDHTEGGEYLTLNASKDRWNPADVVTNTINSYFVEDGSFVRCSDVTIGYTLPKNIVKKLSLSKLRAYVSGGNLFIITSYSGYDPEVDIQSGLTPSMDYNRYPRARTFSFGINATF